MIWAAYEPISTGELTMTFAEYVVGRNWENSITNPVYEITNIINPNWDWKFTQEHVTENWSSLAMSLRYGKDDAEAFFNWLDMDEDGEVSQEEACIAVTSKRFACGHFDYLYQIDFKLDLNMDRMVSRDEYVRALSRSNDLEWSHKPYWTNWLTVDASDPELLSWGHIHER